MGPPQLRPPAHLKDAQRGWWWNLFWAMFDGEPQGYLAVTSDIWLVAGSRDRQRWDAHAASVMAAFDTADIAGQHVIFFPPLLEALEQQRKRLRKPGTPGARGPLHANENSPPRVSSLSLDFDCSNTNSKEERERKRPDAKKPAAAEGGSESDIAWAKRLARR